MRFYRPLGTIAALTFDLDDTLYDNRPVIDRTMQESLNFVRGYHPALANFDAQMLQRWRDELLQNEPEIYHDVTEWRWRALESFSLRWWFSTFACPRHATPRGR